MRKTLTRSIAIAAIAGGIAVGGAVSASAQVDDAHVGPYPTVQEQQEIWIEGGENVGKGSAQLVSAAVLGVPAAFLDYGQSIGNYGAGYMPGVK